MRHVVHRGLTSAPQCIATQSSSAQSLCRPTRQISTNSAINRHLRESGAPRDGYTSNRAPLRDRFRGRDGIKANDAVSVPYTTPMSEFLYGTSVVKAALQARRRKFYKMYIYNGERGERRGRDSEISVMARRLQLDVRLVDGDGLRMMNRMSAARAHNGYVLEASPLPKIVVKGLLGPEAMGSTFSAQLEDGVSTTKSAKQTDLPLQCGSSSRYPFVVMLHSIKDEGNLGAMLRSFTYFGIDAVILVGQCAPISAITLKASAGAAEMVPILQATNPAEFLLDCHNEGWKSYAASSKDSVLVPSKLKRSIHLSDPLRDHPSILVLGNEGIGLPKDVQGNANYEVTIERGAQKQGVLDSLNVSVAGALLIEAFLRPTFPGGLNLPTEKRQINQEGDRLF